MENLIPIAAILVIVGVALFLNKKKKRSGGSTNIPPAGPPKEDYDKEMK